eukprot:6046204-Lingulodinium_polyedra.AAC.1
MDADGEQEAWASSTLAAALLPFASSPGFIQYGDALKKSPLDVPLLRRQREVLTATVDFVDAQ